MKKNIILAVIPITLLTSFNQSINKYPSLSNSLTVKQKELEEKRKENEPLLNSSDTHLLKFLELDKIVEGIDISPNIQIEQTIISEYKELSYSDSSIVNKLNIDLYNLVNRYMSKTQFIPVKDPLWFIAIGNVEYGYQSNPNGLIFSFPVKLEDYNSTFIEDYNWKYVYDNWGLDATTRRTGGAIGPYQLESFFASNVNGVIPEDLGKRQDCWIELGDNPTPKYGSSITWSKGIKADRWSIADSANLTLDVYDTTLKRVNGECALTELTNKYAQVTLLMWGHNRGTGILGNYSYSTRAYKVANYSEEIRQFIKSRNIVRFSRTKEIMELVSRISKDTGADNYPIMCLISYIILEENFKGVVS